METNSVDSEPSKATKKLPILSKPREPVSTSIGTLYAGYISIGALEKFSEIYYRNGPSDKEKFKSLGELALETLIFFDDTEPGKLLGKEQILLLSDKDVRLLCEGISKASSLTPVEAGEPLVELGRSIAAEIRGIKKATKTLMDSMVGRQARWSPDIQQELNRSLGGIRALTEALNNNQALKAIEKVNAYHQKIKNMLPVQGPFEKDLSGAKQYPTELAPQNLGVSEDLSIPSNVPSSNTEPIDCDSQSAPATTNGLQELATIVSRIGDKFSDVHDLIAKVILPQWSDSLRKSDVATQRAVRQANTGLEHARKGIKVAVVAIYISIFVAVLTAGFQFITERTNRIEDAKGQEQSMQLMKEQLDSLKKLNEQLLRNNELLAAEARKVSASSLAPAVQK